DTRVFEKPAPWCIRRGSFPRVVIRVYPQRSRGFSPRNPAPLQKLSDQTRSNGPEERPRDETNHRCWGAPVVATGRRSDGTSPRATSRRAALVT
ncbi:hypothetical protein PCANC_07941, partial [Puccinia coronata f. sp. avenae]